MTVQGFTVYDLFARGAALLGAAPAIFQRDREISFGELRRRIDALAGGLHALGLARGDRVCIVAQNDAAYLDLYGACARQGLLAYPINWRLTAEEVQRVVERADPRMVVVDDTTQALTAGWLDAKTAIRHRYRFGEGTASGFEALAGLYRPGAAPAAAEITGDEPFAAISTAAVDLVPRGAVLTHANVVMANLTMIAHLGLTAADRYLLALPMFHITALGSALAQLHAGGACVLVSRYDAEEAVRLTDRHRITYVSDFPPVLATLLDAAEKQGSRLASLRIVAGLDAPATIQRLHAQTGAQFWTGFGQSETSGFVTVQRVADRPGASGRPVVAAQVKLVDEYEREVPVGTPGEIVVRGPLVFQGYFAQPDVTAYTFRGGWHHTGDVGRFDEDGYLHYVKRKPEKELIKPGGENVYPAEVETVIMEMDGVRAVCVYGIPDARWGEAVKAVVEVADAGRYTTQQVMDHVGSRIARFKRPHAVAFTDKLPRGADGAVDRDAVKSTWGDGA